MNTDQAQRRNGRRAPATDADRRLANIRAFEANLGALRSAFPGLRHERTGSRIEWFVRGARPLADAGLELKGALSIDIPCSEDTAEILDAMAYANDATLGRARLDRELAEEMAYLAGRLDLAVEHLRRLAARDLAAGGLRRDAYLRKLSAELSGKSLNLFPAWSQDEGKDYRPGQHIRDRVKAACAAASKAAKGSESGSGRGPGRHRRRAEPARRGRPFRMRTTSPLYD